MQPQHAQQHPVRMHRGMPVVAAIKRRCELARRAREEAAEFRWPEVDGVALNQLLFPTLRRMTAGHCAYCDHFELGEGSRETIDHFRPKSRFPEFAYAWDNLFPACDQCQQHKVEDFHDDLLRPDEPGYRFERYFLFNSHTGMIEINPQASPDDQRRAAFTRVTFGLNQGRRPDARRRWFKSHFSPRQWAKGRRLEHFVNGIKVIEVTDNDAKGRALEGLIALQIHAGPPMLVEFKDIQLQTP
jgi:uncharacterized protein (TIGR02646 family)